MSLYLHVPFCTTKCGYCDFYSLGGGVQPTGRLVECLLAELTRRLTQFEPVLVTIFVGGGTPTVLGGQELTRLFWSLGQLASLHPVGEFTVEANPETLDTDKANALLRADVTRLSLGAQSFHPAELAVLERIHDPASLAASVKTARAAGFEQINLDLIFGIPGQTLVSWRDSLRAALELEPTHLACYGLTYEPGTALAARRDRGLVQPCDENLEAEMFCATIDELAAAGFQHYEISNYALPGCRCEHNLRYWRNEPYLGIGPSAASYVNGRRWRNVPHLDRYLQTVEAGCWPETDVETLDALSAIRETAMLGLRLREGVAVAAVRRRFGVDPLALFRPMIESFSALGLLEADQRFIRLTRRGLMVANEVMAEFLTGQVDEAAISNPVATI